MDWKKKEMSDRSSSKMSVSLLSFSSGQSTFRGWLIDAARWWWRRSALLLHVREEQLAWGRQCVLGEDGGVRQRALGDDAHEVRRCWVTVEIGATGPWFANNGWVHRGFWQNNGAGKDERQRKMSVRGKRKKKKKKGERKVLWHWVSV